MTKKKIRMMVVFMPVIGVLIILGGVIYLVLQMAMIPAHAGGEDNHVPQAYERVEADLNCTFEEKIGEQVDEAFWQKTGRPYRVLPPGSMATMDYNPARLNIHTDEDGVVTEIRCG